MEERNGQRTPPRRERSSFRTLRRSPWSSPSTRTRKRVGRSLYALSPDKAGGEDFLSSSPVLSSPLQTSMDSPHRSASPLIVGKRPRNAINRHVRLIESLQLSPTTEPPKTGDGSVRRSFSLISEQLSSNNSRYSRWDDGDDPDSSLDSTNALRDSLSKLGKRLFHDRDDGAETRKDLQQRRLIPRAKVAYDREITVRQGALQRHISVQRENPQIGRTKYIEPIGMAEPYSAFKALRLTHPRAAKTVQRVLDDVLHHGSRGQDVHWMCPSEDSTTKRPSLTLLSPSELVMLATLATDLLKTSSSTLVEIEAPVKVFGDIHGQFADLLEFFRRYGSPSHRHGDVNICNYVFNGDFVDRGAHSLEVIAMLLCLTLRYHPRVVMLRGNHEDASLNRVYGFESECKNRLGESDASAVLEACWRLFEYLPLAALIDKRVLCMHGGIGRHVKRLDQIRSIPRPITLRPGFVHKNPVVVDILWSDPVQSTSRGSHECPTTSKRGVGTLFSHVDVEKFCMNNDIDLIIRAHECVEPGWAVVAGGRCITVFSAPKYCGTHRNAAALLEINRQLEVQCKKILCEEASGQWVNIDGATPPPSPREDDRDARERASLGNASMFDGGSALRQGLQTLHEGRPMIEGEDEDDGMMDTCDDDIKNETSTPMTIPVSHVSPPPPPPSLPLEVSTRELSERSTPTLMLSISDNRSREKPRLVVVSPRSLARGQGEGHTVGRSNECRVQVPNTCDLVSREHLKLSVKDGAWHVADVSSMGTACRKSSDTKKTYRLQPKRQFKVDDGMAFYLGSFKEGGAVVKAKLISPRNMAPSSSVKQ